jgi:hypothetical protein
MPFIYKPQLLGPPPCFVDNLPTEILAEVFANLVTSHSYLYTKEVAILLEEESLALRRASQVSQFWRKVALHQCSNIWGSIINIDTSSSAWVEELISRSRDSLLTIQSLHIRREPKEDFCGAKWTSIFAEMARVKILHVTLGRHEDVSQLMYATSNLQAPILESFRVYFFASAPRLFSFNGRLFDNHCPNLRDLVVVTGVLFIQRTMDFSTIRLVHLDITPDLSSVRPTVSQWLDVLETQPSLRYLTMEVYSVSGNETYPIFSREVRLPNLEKFSIGTAGMEGAHLFASLVLPSHCGIAIEIMEEDKTLEDLSFIETFGETIARCIKRWSGTCSKLGSWGLEVDEIDFVLGLGSDDDKWDNPRIQLHYVFSHSDGEDEEEILPSFLDVFQRKGIVDAAHSCTLDLLEFRIPNGLIAFFSQCGRNITHLRLVYHHSLWFVGGLLHTPEPGGGTLLFPSLNHVTLYNPRIDEFGSDHAYGDFQSSVQLISAARRGIPTITLRVYMDNERQVNFAARATNSFGSKIEIITLVSGPVFEEVRAPRWWVGGNELRVLAL